MPAVFSVVFIHSLGLGIVYPILPFRALELGADTRGVTLVLSVHLLAQLLAGPIWGWLSDRFGRRNVFGASLAVAAGAYLMLGWVDSMAGLLFAHLISGFSGAVLPLAQATMADMLGPRDKARGMAYVMASYGSAFIVGPLIAGFAADALTANFMFAAVAAAGCSIAALSVSFVFLDSTSGSIATLAEPGSSEPNRQLVPSGSIYFLAPILLVFVFGFVYSGFDTTLALRVTDHFQWGAREFGYLFAIAGATTVISQLCLTPWLHKLMGDWRIIGVSGLALASGLGALGFTQTGIGAVAGIVLATAGAATAVVCLQSVIAQTCKRSLRGAALGIGHSALTVARLLGPLWAGICFGVLGPEWFYISGVVIVMAVVVLAPSLEWGGRGSVPRRIIEGAR